MKERGTKKLQQLKHLSLKIQKATSKNGTITEKKKNNIRQIIYTNQGHLPTKVTPDINFADEPVVQCVSVVENTFVDDCK